MQIKSSTNSQSAKLTFCELVEELVLENLFDINFKWS